MLNLSDSKIQVAVITGLFLIIGVIITGLFNKNNSGKKERSTSKKLFKMVAVFFNMGNVAGGDINSVKNVQTNGKVETQNLDNH